MEQVKQGHNEIIVQAGQRYNVSFDVDYKNAISERDVEIKRLMGVAVKMAMKITELEMKILDLESMIQ